MTRKEKIKYLSKYRETNSYIKSLMAEREEIITLATHITTSYSFAPGGSGNHSKIESCAIRIAELEKKIDAEMAALMESRKAIVDTIEKAPKQNYRTILRYRFMSGMRYEKIADVTHTTTRNVRKLIAAAVDSIEVTE